MNEGWMMNVWRINEESMKDKWMKDEWRINKEWMKDEWRLNKGWIKNISSIPALIFVHCLENLEKIAKDVKFSLFFTNYNAAVYVLRRIYSLGKELSICHNCELWYSNSYIFATQCGRP